MNVDLRLLERWLTCWSLSRGVPPPQHSGGGLVVEVGLPDQLRRHVFAEAGPELLECARQIDAPHVFLKAVADTDQMRRALPDRWTIESPGYLMHCPTAMHGSVTLPEGYVAKIETGPGKYFVRLCAANGEEAGSGHVVLNGGTAVFDRIETREAHRRKGLGTALMCTLDSLVEQAGVSERLLVATEAGRGLYCSMGWQVLAPYSTAVLAA